MDATATAATTMWAYVGAPEGPVLRHVAAPTPSDEEAVVAVEAFSINRGELGLFAHRGEGWRPGQDIAGRIVVPARAGGPPAGARVVGMVDFGGWAQQAAVPLRRLSPLPDEVNLEQAACFGVAGLTALRALRRGTALLGARVLITGASGGVGSFAIQLALAGGAQVSAVLGENRKLDLSQAPGNLIEVVDSVEDTHGEFDLILESVGGPTLLEALRRAAPDGHIVVLGTSSGSAAPLSMSSFRAHARQTLHPFWVYGSGESVSDDLAILARLCARGLLAPVIGWRSSWHRLPEAIRALSARTITGKAVLLVDHKEHS